MELKPHDFIEIAYIAKIKETNKIFDLTDKELAKKHNIFNPNFDYSPKIICLGENNIIKGLDEALIGKSLGKYIIELTPEKAFGKKDPKLIKLVQTNLFKKQNITPFPGLQVNIDNLIGTIRTVTGGRTLVDFNHPLSGKNIIYEINIKRIVTDPKEKLKAILTPLDYKLNNSDLTIENSPEYLKENLTKKIKELIPEIKKINFTKKENTKE